MKQFEWPFDCGETMDESVNHMLAWLEDGRWHTATGLLRGAGLPVSENNKRLLRRMADCSGGRIAGGQKGYKLVAEMTLEEYQHARNAMLSQARELQRRVLEMDKEFYRRHPVNRAI